MQHEAAQSSAGQSKARQGSAVQHNRMQCDAVQCSAVPCSAVPCRAVQRAKRQAPPPRREMGHGALAQLAPRPHVTRRPRLLHMQISRAATANGEAAGAVVFIDAI